MTVDQAIARIAKIRDSLVNLAEAMVERSKNFSGDARWIRAEAFVETCFAQLDDAVEEIREMKDEGEA